MVKKKDPFKKKKTAWENATKKPDKRVSSADVPKPKTPDTYSPKNPNYVTPLEMRKRVQAMKDAGTWGREGGGDEIFRDKQTGEITGFIGEGSDAVITGKKAEERVDEAIQQKQQETARKEFSKQQESEAELIQRQEELLPIAEETGVFEERRGKVELNPPNAEVAKAGLLNQNKGFRYGALYPKVKEVFGIENDDEFQGLMQNPETARQVMINEIQKEIINEERTISQKLGARLEPFLGELKFWDVDIGGYVDKFFRMPKKEAESIVGQIEELTSSISGMTDAASQGEIGNPAEVLRELDKRDKELAVYEARIYRLILESPELQLNPETVNEIEEKIRDARDNIFEAKQRAAEGALITPTDGQLYLKLQEVKGK